MAGPQGMMDGQDFGKEDHSGFGLSDFFHQGFVESSIDYLGSKRRSIFTAGLFLESVRPASARFSPTSWLASVLMLYHFS